MKRRQHVGKKRSRVRIRRKARVLGKISKRLDEVISATMDRAGPTPIEERVSRLEDGVGRLEDGMGGVQMNLNRLLFPPQAASAQKRTPHLDKGVVISTDSLITDLDGELWFMRPSIGSCSRVQ